MIYLIYVTNCVYHELFTKESFTDDKMGTIVLQFGLPRGEYRVQDFPESLGTTLYDRT